MVVGEASIHNIMGGMESTGGVRLHNHKRKLKQRFDIIKKLGQGTYGKVQLGINKETGQEVAIKTIKKCKIETEADLVRIRREIQIMSSVQHPNIIHIYEVFENREKMVLVMEYAAGGELYDYLSQRKVLTEEEARRIFRQIVTAVFYCHKHNICHRDLKLENILLDQIGNAKIADFGLSNVFDGKRLLNTFCGSPLYASPEIVKGTPYHGPEVDCWSLGVLLYTLVYGAMPFDGSNFKRLVKQISSSDYFEPKVPSPASTLIKEMLTVCPGTRSDIQKICTHWWVNETYDKNCLLIAEELAAQTPVRLDLLLSLVPQSANADKLVVGEHQSDETNLPTDTTSEVLMPTRSYSADNFMEFERSTSTGVMREITDVESSTRQTNNGDAKRKLESTSSVDENMAALTKRKEVLKTEKDNDNASSIKSQTPMDIDSTSEVLPPPVENTEKPLEINKLTPENKSEGETNSKVKPNKITVDLTGKHVMMDSITKDNNPEEEIPKQESPVKTVMKLRDKSHSLDSASISDVTKAVKTVERRRSKIFETAEKFNQMLSNVESEKPKKIFIPGVNVGGAKRAFERKASLNSGSAPISSKEKITPKLGKNLDKKSEKTADEEKLTIDDVGKIEKDNSQEENTSISSKSDPSSKRNLIIQLGPNDLRAATVTVSTPVDTKLSPELKQDFQPTLVSDVEPVKINSTPEKPKKSSKMEITLQSTAKGASPKTMKTEIMLGELKSPQSPTYKTEIEAKINSADPRKIQTQRSEVAFPIAAVSPQISASSSYDDNEKPTIAFRKERSVPIQMDLSYNPMEQKRAPLKYPSADYSESFERQSTIDSDTDNTSKSVIGPEPIRKSPREYIIPIAVEGANYITPRVDSVDIESKNSASSLSSLSRSRFGKSRRISSLLSDASEDDESPFLSLSRDSDDLFQRHMHRLRSSRPRRQPSDLADSLSSGEEDDDDGFELLTAENLFSTLLSRVRSLTQRLNVDDNKNSLFPNSRLLGRFDSNPSQSFWGTREPLSRRISESQFQRSSNCDMDRLSRKNSFGMMNPKYQDSQTSLGESSKESLSSSGRSNTLPRDNYHDNSTEEAQFNESLDYNFTPSLTRRLNSKFSQQSRIHTGVSPFNSPEKNYQQIVTDSLKLKKDYDNENCNTNLKQTGERNEKSERSLRRSTSLLEPRNDLCGFNFASLRNPDSFFDNREKLLSSRWKTGDREYRRGFSVGRIPEFPNMNADNNLESNLFTDSISACDSSTNLHDSASSRSIMSCESSAANSLSNIQDHSSSSTLPYKSKPSRNFEIRLLAAESLIKASKFKNLDEPKLDSNSKFETTNAKFKNDDSKFDSKFDTNTKFDTSTKFDTNTKLDSNINNKTPDVISEMVNSMIMKRNRSIPFPRFRSSSLNREFGFDERRKSSFTSADSSAEKSLFQKLPKFQRHDEEESSSSTKDESNDSKIEKGQRRISRFLRPDFFDTPREESQYVKDKEAKKALENERRKSRFMRKPIETAFDPIQPISNPITTKQEEIPSDDQHKKTSENSYLKQLSNNDNEVEKLPPTDSALFTHYIPETADVNEKTKIDEAPVPKKSSKTFSKSKTVPRIDVPSKEEVKTSESASNMRFRSKIPTKFKKNETNAVKKITDSNKLPNTKTPEVSSLSSSSSTSKVKKKDNELSLLQRSKTEVKKSLEQCSKLVKKYSLENSKKLKEKELGAAKTRTNSIEKEKSSERSLEKNSTRNIVQVEIVSDRTTPDKKQSTKTDKAFREKSQSPNSENNSEENGKKIVKKILPSLSKINSTLKNHEKVEKKLLKRTKTKEVNEKENDVAKKKEENGIKKKDDQEKIPNTKKKELDIKKKENQPEIKKKEIDNILQKKKKISTFKKTSNKIEKKQSPDTSESSEEKFDFKNTKKLNDTKNNVLPKQEKFPSLEKIPFPEIESKEKAPKFENSRETKSPNFEATDSKELKTLFYQTSENLNSRPKEQSKSPDLSQIDTSEYFNFCPSDCETRSDSTQPVRDTQEQESIIDRIRRKSFYSRFNDRKRKTLVTPLTSRSDMWPSMTLPKNFSFTSSKKTDSNSKPNKRNSLYNNILSDTKSTDRNRYSFCSDNSISSLDNNSLPNNDLARRKYSTATDFNTLGKNHFGNNTIPRKENKKFPTMGHCDEETIAKNWSYSSIPSESCSNDFMEDGANFMQTRKKD